MAGDGQRFDIMVFGATGFTGQFVVQEVLEAFRDNKLSQTMAVAGRNEKKIRESLASVEQRSGISTKDIPIIIADVKDEASIDAMTVQSKVVINCVGPYVYFGEIVVKSCIKNGASHVDISGEPLYLDGMQVKYAKEAEAAGVYVVGSCGFDSIPTDLGVVFLTKSFDGDINSVETYVSNTHGPKGYKINIGTWRSLVNGIATAGTTNQLRENRAALFPKTMPKPAYKLSFRSLHKDPTRPGWCLPFPSCDRSVVRRTQYYLWEKQRMRPAQVGCYINLGSLFATFAIMLWASFLFLATRIGPLKRYMEEHPELFSAGVFSKTGPTMEQMLAQRFKVTLHGKGWKEKLTEASDQHSTPTDSNITVEVEGPDPGYIGTSKCLVCCALTILEEPNKLPKRGGVFTPGAAFYNTTLIDRLNKRGVTFTLK